MLLSTSSLIAHPGWTHRDNKPPQNLEKQSALEFNQSAVKNTALSAEEPNQKMDGWIQIESCTQIHNNTFRESNPEWIHPSKRLSAHQQKE
jgi:hypothetical protein